MKYMGLILAFIKGLFLISVTAWLLQEIRENFVYGKALLPWSVFIAIMGGGLGAAFSIGAKGCLREIKKLKDTERPTTTSNKEESRNYSLDGFKNKSEIMYTYPRIFGYLAIAIGVFFLVFPFFGAGPGIMIHPSGYLIVFGLSGCILATGIYYMRYVVIINAQKIIIRTIFKREFLFSNIVKVEVTMKGLSPGAMLILKDGREIHIDKILKNFNGLLESLKIKTVVKII